MSFGDIRVAERADWLIERVAAAGTLVLRKLGETRAGEKAIHRFLSSPYVSADQIDPLRFAGEQQVDVAFAIRYHRHFGCLGQHAGRRLATRQPAHRVLFLDRTAAAGGHAPLGARPDFRIDKPNHGLTLDIDRNHRMDEEAGRLAVTGRSKATPLLVTASKIDLAGVLNCQYAAASALDRRPRSQRLDNRKRK